jgi:hypothetical protein
MKSRKRRTRRRRQRGGIRPKLDFNQIQWPQHFGCADQVEEISLNPGQFIDRFGCERGFFVSPLERQPYSYSERSLPWLGNIVKQYPNNKGALKARGEIFMEEYMSKPMTDDDYHVYEVIKEINHVEKCKIAPAFNYPGGGIQFKLPQSIETFIASKHLRELVNFPVVPRYQ